MLFLSNLAAARLIRQLKGKIKRHTVVDGATIYYLTDREKQRELREAEVDAFVLGESVFVRTKSLITPRLLAHELKHVQQAREIPFFAFRYLLESWLRSYSDNRYERQARYAERRARR